MNTPDILKQRWYLLGQPWASWQVAQHIVDLHNHHVIFAADDL